ncbi:MAG: hypothetical protein NT079_04300 [Candidatus Omnitrophica bacterium]|nr:hypothetical protein [Candidatus Omnitrophota bacterium]
MKKIILVVALLVSFAGVCYAELDKGCFDRCMSEKYNNNPDDAYCEEVCSNDDADYQQQKLEAQNESQKIQKQQQPQTNAQNPVDTTNEPQQTAPSPVVSDIGNSDQ